MVARALAAAGMRVRIADLDGQQATASAWATTRAEAGIEPAIEAREYETVRAALAERRTSTPSCSTAGRTRADRPSRSRGPPTEHHPHGPDGG